MRCLSNLDWKEMEVEEDMDSSVENDHEAPESSSSLLYKIIFFVLLLMLGGLVTVVLVDTAEDSSPIMQADMNNNNNYQSVPPHSTGGLSSAEDEGDHDDGGNNLPQGIQSPEDELGFLDSIQQMFLGGSFFEGKCAYCNEEVPFVSFSN